MLTELACPGLVTFSSNLGITIHADIARNPQTFPNLMQGLVKLAYIPISMNTVRILGKMIYTISVSRMFTGWTPIPYGFIHLYTGTTVRRQRTMYIRNFWLRLVP